MFPYDESRSLGARRRWLMQNRFAHLVAATEKLPGLSATHRGIAMRRRAAMMRLGRLRAAVLVALYFNAAVTLAGVLQPYLPELGLFELLSFVAGVTGALAGVLALTFFFLTRMLGQLEADLIGLLLTHRPRTTRQ